MTATPSKAYLEHRVLVLAPTGRDAELAAQLLAESGMVPAPCETLLDVCERFEEGAGAIILAEEALLPEETERLVDCLRRQPPWSDVPLIVLTATHDGVTQAHTMANLFGSVGNMVFLERPFHLATFLSTIRGALRARRRQYDIRDLLQSERAAHDELHVVQAALAQALERFTFSIDAAQIGTFFCPMPLDEIVWDAKCKEHFWLPDHEVVNFERFYSLLHPDDRARTKEAIEQTVYGRKPYDIQFRTISSTGQVRWVRATGRAYHDPQGNPIRFDGITIDITQQKLTEEVRERLLQSEKSARQEAERVSRMKDDFLATLSHELRTPLNAIFGWAQLLKHGRDNPDTIERGVEVIDRNVRRQTQLIDDLLDMSRIVSGKVTLDSRLVQPAGIISDAMDAVRPAAEAKGVTLASELDPGMSPVMGDPARLQQVILNLLTNAIKFTPAGGSIVVGLRRADGNVEISVRDTGEGITADFLPYLFERFRQADESSTRAHGGLGLGLSIAKQLVELHQGEIRVQSPGRGAGATFTVSLPAWLDRPENAVQGQGAKRVPACKDGEPPSLRGLRVLIVDDEPDSGHVIERLLQIREAETLVAASGDEGEALIGAFSPHVIVSDISMPGRSGYEFMLAVRDRGIVTPAIALTAFARADDRQRSLAAGFQRHLAKPVEPTELLETVAALAGRAAASSRQSA